MLQKTTAIILRTLKYSDNSIIATVYTKNIGKVSVILNSVHSKKSNNKINYLQPFFIVEMELYFKEKNNIHKVKEIKPQYNYKTLPYNITKSSLAFFLSEVLYKSIKEEEENEALYNFIEQAILYIDEETEKLSNFHLYFLMGLTKLLGFFPINNFSDKNAFFDINKAQFVDIKHGNEQINFYESKLFSELIKLEFNNFAKFKIDKLQRNILLENILRFYKKQIAEFGTIKSLEIMQEIFS